MTHTSSTSDNLLPPKINQRLAPNDKECKLKISELQFQTNKLVDINQTNNFTSQNKTIPDKKTKIKKPFKTRGSIKENPPGIPLDNSFLKGNLCLGNNVGNTNLVEKTIPKKPSGNINVNNIL
ncbi:MAG: hypothetical protein MJ252_19095 [archaeon]|nr:hypothetical protein [archaeon]